MKERVRGQKERKTNKKERKIERKRDAKMDEVSNVMYVRRNVVEEKEIFKRKIRQDQRK